MLDCLNYCRRCTARVRAPPTQLTWRLAAIERASGEKVRASSVRPSVRSPFSRATSESSDMFPFEYRSPPDLRDALHFYLRARERVRPCRCPPARVYESTRIPKTPRQDGRAFLPFLQRSSEQISNQLRLGWLAGRRGRGRCRRLSSFEVLGRD